MSQRMRRALIFAVLRVAAVLVCVDDVRIMCVVFVYDDVIHARVRLACNPSACLSVSRWTWVGHHAQTESSRDQP